MILRNLPILDSDYPILDQKTAADEAARLICKVSPSFPFFCSPLGIIPKHDGGRRRIHHLSYPEGLSVNDFIEPSFGSLEYVTFDAVVQSICAAGRGCYIMKRDIRDAFRMIPIAAPDRYLLGFA